MRKGTWTVAKGRCDARLRNPNGTVQNSIPIKKKLKKLKKTEIFCVFFLSLCENGIFQLLPRANYNVKKKRSSQMTSTPHLHNVHIIGRGWMREEDCCEPCWSGSQGPAGQSQRSILKAEPQTQQVPTNLNWFTEWKIIMGWWGGDKSIHGQHSFLVSFQIHLLQGHFFHSDRWEMWLSLSFTHTKVWQWPD